MMDEGVIKFNCHWEQSQLPQDIDCVELLQTRNELYQLGLIGFDENENVGYGNISRRAGGNQFVISGTQTGHMATLTIAQLSFVINATITDNTVYCSGPAKASSESLTHAAIYELLPAVNAVIHVHHHAMWQQLKGKLPTTLMDIGYGTQAMANEIERLLQQENLEAQKILAMAGHQDGIISFGKTMEEAMQILMHHYQS